jgi:nucleotide-binding universal stress UspA family protein
MKCVLVGFDGSEGAKNALNKAMTIIDDNGELVLLAIIPLPSDRNLLDQKSYELIKMRTYNLLNSMIHDIGFHRYSINGLVKEAEDTASAIIDVANELHCDLIVLGSRGSSGFGNYSIGSVANKVVQFAAKPVMIVR